MQIIPTQLGRLTPHASEGTCGFSDLLFRHCQAQAVNAGRAPRIGTTTTRLFRIIRCGDQPLDCQSLIAWRKALMETGLVM